MTVRSIQITRKDTRLVGAKYAALTETNRAAISCPDIKRLTIVNLADAGSVVGSLKLSRTPGALLYLNTYIWTVTDDGYVVGYYNGNVPAQAVISDYIGSDRSSWLTTANNFVIAPGRVGSVACLWATDGRTLSEIDCVLSRIEVAVGDGEYIYCFDGRGLGAVLHASDEGVLSKVNVFIAQDCQGALRAHVHNGQLVVVVDQLETVAVFDLDDAEAPSRASRTEYLGTHLNSAMDNDDRTALTDEERADPGLSPFYPIVHGLVAASLADLYLHGPTGRITYTTDTSAIDLLATVPAGHKDLDTNYTISVVLASQPLVDHVVTFSAIGNLSITSGGTLTFTNANWNTPQSLVVQASSAGLYEIPYSIASADGGIRTGQVGIQIEDLAVFGIDAVVTAATHYVTLAYPVLITLSGQPSANNDHVVVFTAPAGASIFGGATFTFTHDNWNVPQTIYVVCDYPAGDKTFPCTITPQIGSATVDGFTVTFSDVPTPQFLPYIDVVVELESLDHIKFFDEIIDLNAPGVIAYIDV